MSSQERYDAFRAFLFFDEARRRLKREKMICAIAEAPVSDATLQQLIWLGPTDADEVLRHHPGYEIDEVLSSLSKMLDVYRCSWKALSTELDCFREFAQKPSSLHRSQETTLKDVQSKVRKEVFCLSSAAMSLVAIAQKLETKMSIPGYRDKVGELFISSPEHHFVKKLRNNLNHGWFASADWMMSWSTTVVSGEFTFSSSDLLQNGDFNSLAKGYIRAAGDRIKVRQLFASYSAKIEHIFGWIEASVGDYLPATVVDYRRCVSARRANASRCHWRLVLSQIAIPKQIDPFQQLHRFLTEDQLQEVQNLPHRSLEQVDRIIELVDEHQACDAELKALVYQLFGIQQ